MVISLDFLFKVMIYVFFWFKSEFVVTLSLDFLSRVIIFANFGLKVANFLRFSI